MNFSNVYALSAAAWSIGGFVVGYAAASMITIMQLREDASKDVVDIEDERRVLHRLLVVVLIGLALLSTIIGWRGAEKAKESADIQRAAAEKAEAIAVCQSQFNADITEIQNKRDELSEAGRKDLVEMWDVVTKAIRTQNAADGKAAQKAIFEYNARLHERDRQRAQLDLPNIETLDCAHPKTGKAGSNG